MDFSNFIGKKVYVTLFDRFYWSGHIINANSDHFILRDIHGHEIFIANQSVATLREVNQDG